MIKCPFCGGSVVYHPGNLSEPAEHRCIHCGRNPEQRQSKTAQGLFDKEMAARNYSRSDPEIEE